MGSDQGAVAGTRLVGRWNRSRRKGCWRYRCRRHRRRRRWGWWSRRRWHWRWWSRSGWLWCRWNRCWSRWLWCRTRGSGRSWRQRICRARGIITSDPLHHKSQFIHVQHPITVNIIALSKSLHVAHHDSLSFSRVAAYIRLACESRNSRGGTQKSDSQEHNRFHS